jgi:hypothetical protein
MNWGHKILIIYIVFITGISFLVVKSFSQSEDLVTSDYYEQELRYQERIDEKSRASRLSSDLRYAVNGQKIEISFPNEMKGKKVEANIWLYCTSNAKNDIHETAITTNGTTHLALTKANKGLHELKVSWAVNGQRFYFEHKLVIL